MRHQRQYVDYLQDILLNLDRAQRFTAQMDFGSFTRDDKTHLVVTHVLELVGEAAKHVSLAVRRRHPEVPWKEMAGMRDRLIHGYFGVDLEIVWKTVKEQCPTLRSLLAKVLENENKASRAT